MQHLDVLEQLTSTIAARRQADPASSYVASLFAKGRSKIAQKVAEEGAELAIAAVSEGRDKIVSEAADVLFHLLVLLEQAEIGLDEVLAELKRREGLSGLDEKASR